LTVDTTKCRKDNIIFTLCGLALGLILGSFLIGPHLAKSRLASAPVQGDPNMMARVRQQLDSLEQTVERDPNNLDALAQLGGMYMDAAKYRQAIEYFERALRVRPDPVLRSDLAICFKQSGRPDRALEELQRVVQDDPTQWQARFNEIVLLGEMRRFDEARSEMAQLEKLRPDGPDVRRLDQALAQAR